MIEAFARQLACGELTSETLAQCKQLITKVFLLSPNQLVCSSCVFLPHVHDLSHHRFLLTTALILKRSILVEQSSKTWLRTTPPGASQRVAICEMEIL